MDYVCRCLCEAQQDFFSWVSRRANNQATRESAPDCKAISDKILTYRAASLSPLPSQWYTMFGRPVHAPQERSGGRPSNSPREQAGAVPQINPSPDASLMRRFAASGHPTITALMEGHDVRVPSHRGNPVCLTWALKGECSTGCRRKAQHQRYSRSVIQEIHDLMTTCGVANPQE